MTSLRSNKRRKSQREEVALEPTDQEPQSVSEQVTTDKGAGSAAGLDVQSNPDKDAATTAESAAQAQLDMAADQSQHHAEQVRASKVAAVASGTQPDAAGTSDAATLSGAEPSEADVAAPSDTSAPGSAGQADSPASNLAPSDASAPDSGDSSDSVDQPDSAESPEDEKPRVHALLAVSKEGSHHSSKGSHGHHHHHHHRHHHRHGKGHRHHRSLGRRIAHGLLMVLLVLVIAAVLAAGVLAVYLYNSVKAGEEKVLAAGRPKAAATQTADAPDDAGDVVKDEDAPAENLYTPTINNTITYKGKTYAPNEKMVSIAFIGSDGHVSGGTVGQADAVVLFTFNLETGAVKVISIPRDSMVDVSEYAGDAYVGQDKMQLCLAYSYGDGAWTSSQRVADLVSRVLYDVPVSYYFTLNLQGIAALNDAIGGVTLTPLQTVAKSENIVEGQEMTLWGDDARLYVQWRDETDNTSSLARQQRQMQYLSAFFEQAIAAAKADPAVIANIYNTAAEYSWTTLGFDEFSYLATQVLSMGITSVDVESLPGTMGMGEKYAEFYLDKEGVRQIVLDTFYHEVDATESNDALSEERGKADNASIASDESAAENAQAAEGAQVVEGTQASDGSQAADGEPTTQEAAPLERSAEDQAALDAANGAVGEAAANW